MSIDRNDPRLTAYALGEMDPTESAAFEAELDDAARAEVDAIRQVAERVKAEWKDGGGHALDAEQRQRIVGRKRIWWLVPTAAAAAILAAAAISLMARGDLADLRAANERVAELETELSDMETKNGVLVRELSAEKAIASQSVAARNTSEQKVAELARRLSAGETASGKDRATIEQLSNQVKAQVEINRTYKEWLEKFQTSSGKDSALLKQLADQVKAQVEINRSYKQWLEKFAREAKVATSDKLRIQNKWQKEVTQRVGLEKKLREQAKRYVMLQKQVASAAFWLAKYRQKYGDVTGGPKGSPGIVKSVKGNLVVLSIGTDDGVRNGDTYQIRRGSEHVGQVTITTVYKDQSVGTFDTEFKGPGAPPKAGDAADPRGYGG